MSSNYENIHRTIAVQAPPGKVSECLTSEGGLRGWLAQNAELTGDRIALWGPSVLGSTDERLEAQLLLLEPNRIAYRSRVNDQPTNVAWEVVPDGDGSRVELKIDAPGNSDPFTAYLLQDSGDLLLANLKAFAEEGAPVLKPDLTGPRNLAHLQVAIHASEDQVFQALTDPAVMNQWIATNAEVDLRDGGRYSYGWSEEMNGESVPTGPKRILKVQAPHLISTDWDWKTESYSQVTWFVEGEGGMTNLTITHCGFGSEWTDAYTLGWSAYLANLKFLLEHRARPKKGAGFVPEFSEAASV